MISQARSAWLRGAEFLLAAQHAEGGWRRSRYGALRGGAALTAMALYALRRGPREFQIAAEKPLTAAVDFLRLGLARRGLVAAPDGTLDLPVYATSLALLADNHNNHWLWSAEHQVAMLAYLLDAQIVESRGFAADDPQRGGWDVGTSPLPRGITTGVNISVTSWALAAITAAAGRMRETERRAALVKRIEDARGEARRWLTQCQNLPGDGGFPFTADLRSPDNKAGFDLATGRGRSYATATCDGLAGLTAADVAQDSPARRAAIEWLEARAAQFGRVPGHAPVAAQADAAQASAGGWSEGLWYYFAARVAEYLDEFRDKATSQAARELLLRELVARQRADGSWANATSYMREDDPLIATPLALLALDRLDL